MLSQSSTHKRLLDEYLSYISFPKQAPGSGSLVGWVLYSAHQSLAFLEK